MVIFVLDSLLAVVLFLLFQSPALRKWVILIICFFVLVTGGIRLYQDSVMLFWIFLVLFLLFFILLCVLVIKTPPIDENSPEAIARNKYKGMSFREIFAEKYREAMQEQAEKQRKQQEAQQQAQQNNPDDEI